MWDYKENIKKYLRIGLFVGTCSVCSILSSGCSEEYWAGQEAKWDRIERENRAREMQKYIDENGNTVIIIDNTRPNLEMDNSGLRREMRRLKKIEDDARRDRQRVTSHTQDMLRRMQEERERLEQEHQH